MKPGSSTTRVRMQLPLPWPAVDGRLRSAAGAARPGPLDGMLDDLLGALSSDGNKDDTVLLGLRWR